MSGTGRLQLTETTPAMARALLPGERNLRGWHAALSQAIAQHFSGAHAFLLAEPSPAAGGTAWSAHGAAMRRFVDLSAADRRALSAAIGVILSDIRRLAESGAAPVVTQAWPMLSELPGYGFVFAVDGRPVIAGWSHTSDAGGGRLFAKLDDGVPWRPAPRTPRGVYAAALALVCLLALLAGLSLPWIGARFWPAATACTVAPGQLALLAEQNGAIRRGEDLQAQLAMLGEELGRRQMQCPIPQAAAPLPPAPQPPPHHADLPQDRWNAHDLSMLQGCWNRYSNMTVLNEATLQVLRVKSWRLCFDAQGRARQEITLNDGRTCRNMLHAHFDDAQEMVLNEDHRCEGQVFNMEPFETVCRRESDTEANCTARDLAGPAKGQPSPSRFRRADGATPPTAGSDQ